MNMIGDLLGALSGMEGATHPFLMQVVHGLDGDAGEPGPGLGWLLGRLRQVGHDDAIRAWARGEVRQSIAPAALHAAIGDVELAAMARRARLRPEEFVGKLSQHLPGIVRQLSHDGVPPA